MLHPRFKQAIRLRHYSQRTEESYVGWIRAFILFHHKRHPRELSEVEVSGFLSHLAEVRRVSASTQNQALSVVRSGKGGKDRVTPLPGGLETPLTRQLERVRRVHTGDLARGFGRVVLPEAIVRKYPTTAVEWQWQ